MIIKVDYNVNFDVLKELCYEAFDSMQVELLTPDATNYFGESPFRVLEISHF